MQQWGCVGTYMDRTSPDSRVVQPMKALITGEARQTQQVCYRHSGSRGKAGLGSVRPGKEPGVRLKLLDREKYPSQSRLADEAGEAVAEGAVVVEEVRVPFVPQGKERVWTCL